jgi:hypothetical protein
MIILQAVMQENMILTLIGIIKFLQTSVKREFKPNFPSSLEADRMMEGWKEFGEAN